MNVVITSDRQTVVNITYTFSDEKIWRHKVYLSGYGPAAVAVIGRTSAHFTSIRVAHDGFEYGYPIQFNTQGDLTINIFGGRDYWTQKLREAALNAKP